MAQDLLLITPLTSSSEWGLDIDIVGGKAREVPGEEENTKRQRVAVAAYITKGTIPGQEDIGADWAGFLANRSSLLDCDNQVKANMEQFANASQLIDAPYPIYQKAEDGLKISLISLKKPAVAGVNS